MEHLFYVLFKRLVILALEMEVSHGLSIFHTVSFVLSSKYYSHYPVLKHPCFSLVLSVRDEEDPLCYK